MAASRPLARRSFRSLGAINYLSHTLMVATINGKVRLSSLPTCKAGMSAILQPNKAPYVSRFLNAH